MAASNERRHVLVACLMSSVCRLAHADEPAPPPALQTEESVEAPHPDPGTAAPWLRPWLEPPVRDPNPILAIGTSASLQASAGALISQFSSLPPLMSITGDYGWFIASSQWQAVSVQTVAKANLVFDRVTPQFASVGLGVRRVGRRAGVGFGSVDFERLSTGLAVMSRGTNLDAGLMLELCAGVMTFSGKGLALYVDAYFFEPTNMSGPETIFTFGLGYVQSPITGLRASVPMVVRKVAPPPKPPSAIACARVDAYRDALARERKHAVEVCNAGDAARCDLARARVRALNEALSSCVQGNDVGPPSEVDDAPVP